MYMLINPLRCEGVALDSQARRRCNAIRGDVRVAVESQYKAGSQR